MWGPQSTQHRCGGRRVRRGHDGSEGNGDRPAHAGHHLPGDNRNHDDGEDYYNQRQTDQGTQIRPQVAWRGVVAGIEQDGCYEQARVPGVDPARLEVFPGMRAMAAPAMASRAG